MNFLKEFFKEFTRVLDRPAPRTDVPRTIVIGGEPLSTFIVEGVGLVTIPPENPPKEIDEKAP